jgi:hypothetical protein
MSKGRSLLALGALCLLVLCTLASPGPPARAATPTFYTDRTTFEASLGAAITDDYGTASYPAGFAVYGDAAFSALFGETDYRTTGFSNWNMHLEDDRYCAGCNGSFELSFQTTSVTEGGIGAYGVGVDILENYPELPYHAFITYGDATTDDLALPVGASFFGATAPELIVSIHFGLKNGGSTEGGFFIIDNLTIGSKYAVYLPLCLNRVGGYLGWLGRCIPSQEQRPAFLPELDRAEGRPYEGGPSHLSMP